jgi:tetratricopeptide (TPR) repeat protein
VWRPVILLDAGSKDEALRAFNEIARVDLAEVRQDWIYLYDIADLAQAALRFGDLAVAARCREALAPHAGLTCVAAAFGAWGGAVDHHLGALALALGDARDALDHLEAALRVHKAFGAGPWAEATQSLLVAAKDPLHRSTGLRGSRTPEPC